MGSDGACTVETLTRLGPISKVVVTKYKRQHFAYVHLDQSLLIMVSFCVIFEDWKFYDNPCEYKRGDFFAGTAPDLFNLNRG